MPIVNYLQEAITKTKTNGSDFEGVFNDGAFIGFEIKSSRNRTSYTISSPRNKSGKSALTFTIDSGLRAIDEKDIERAIISQVITANANFIFSATNRQLNADETKELTTKNLSKQLLAIPTILKITYQNADQIIKGTVEQIENQREEKCLNLIRRHKIKNKTDFTKNFNEYVDITAEQYLESYMSKVSPIGLEEVERSESAYQQYEEENRYGIGITDLGDGKQ